VVYIFWDALAHRIITVRTLKPPWFFGYIIHMGVNSRYKDSVFSLLFSDPDTLRTLYSAIEGVPVDPSIPITINTLSDVLYMERYNDISFTIGNKARNCETLKGYSTFIARVREHEKVMSREEAMNAAIEYCIEHNILSAFLIEHSTEVRNMLLTEWNWDDAKEVWQAEAAQKAWEEGMEKGLEKGQKNILDLVKQGYTTEQIETMLASRSANGLHL
jgi:uncharacterized protein with von Willebrand factor type A (vWA) domain